MKIGFIGKKETFKDFQSAAQQLDIEIVKLSFKKGIPDSSGINCCIVRGTNSHNKEIKEFVKNNPQIDFLDNDERFEDDLGKANSSIERANLGVGAPTYLTKEEVPLEAFPVVVKPILGHNNLGVKYKATPAALQKFFERHNEAEFIIQKKLNLIDEFRCLFVNVGETKEYFITRRRTLVGNGFKRVPNHNIGRAKIPSGKIKNFLQTYRSNKIGIIGYDIGRLSDDEFCIIEENRAPQYKRTEERQRSKLPYGFPYFVLKSLKDYYEL